MLFKARLLSNRYLSIFFRRASAPEIASQALARFFFSPQLFTKMASSSLLANPYLPVSFFAFESVPLAELRLEDVVQVDAHTRHLALVDLDLMQVRGRVGVALRGAPPVVLPEPGPETVLQAQSMTLEFPYTPTR